MWQIMWHYNYIYNKTFCFSEINSPRWCNCGECRVLFPSERTCCRQTPGVCILRNPNEHRLRSLVLDEVVLRTAINGFTCSCVSKHGSMTMKILGILLISNMYIISTSTSAEVVASNHPTASYGQCATNGRHDSTQAIRHNNCAIYFWYM